MGYLLPVALRPRILIQKLLFERLVARQRVVDQLCFIDTIVTAARTGAILAVAIDTEEAVHHDSVVGLHPRKEALHLTCSIISRAY